MLGPLLLALDLLGGHKHLDDAACLSRWALGDEADRWKASFVRNADALTNITVWMEAQSPAILASPQAKAVLAGIAATVAKRVMQGSSRTA